MTRPGVVLRVAAGLYAALFVMLLLGGMLSLVENESGSFGREAGRAMALVIVGPPVATAFIGMYLAPSALAYLRDHQNTLPLAIVNIAFGWSVIGWVGCLAWACSTGLTASQPVVGRLVPPGE